MRKSLLILSCLAACKSVGNQSARSQYELSSVAISVPSKSAFEAGAPFEKINKIRLLVSAHPIDESKPQAECDLVMRKSKEVPFSGGVGNIDIQLPQTCNYRLTTFLHIDNIIVFDGTVAINSVDLLGKATYKASAQLSVTTDGISQGFGKTVTVEVATVQNTDISIDTTIKTSGFDVTKYITVEQAAETPEHIVNTLQNDWKLPMNVVVQSGPWNNVNAQCSVKGEYSFNTKETPPNVLKVPGTLFASFTISTLKATSYFLVPVLSREAIDKIESPVPNSFKELSKVCYTRDDPVKK